MAKRNYEQRVSEALNAVRTYLAAGIFMTVAQYRDFLTALGDEAVGNAVTACARVGLLTIDQDTGRVIGAPAACAA